MHDKYLMKGKNLWYLLYFKISLPSLLQQGTLTLDACVGTGIVAGIMETVRVTEIRYDFIHIYSSAKKRTSI